MKIEVDVLGAEQRWNADTGEEQNYLLISVFGIQTKIPCDAQQLGSVVANIALAKRGAAPVRGADTRTMIRPPAQPEGPVQPAGPLPEQEFSFQPERAQDEPQEVPAPSIFASGGEAEPRERAPMRSVRRPVEASDDAGIEQG